MAEQNSGSAPAAPGWVQGVEIASLTKEAAKAEIKAIERDPAFLGEDKNYWARQQMLNRRTELYRHVGVEGSTQGMAYELTRQGVTHESLEKQIEGYKDRDWEENKRKARLELEGHFGGEKPAKEAIKAALSVVARFAKDEDKKFIDESGLGNDPEFIKLLVSLDEKLKRGRKKK